MRYSLLGLIMSICSFGLYAQDFSPLKDDAHFRVQVKRIADKTETLASDFVQEKNISFISEPIITKGKFSFKKENLLRWEYNDPFNYVLILNGGKVLIDDEGNINEIDMGNNAMFKEINKTMSNALLGKVLEDTDQFTNEIGENANYYQIKLFPIDPKMTNYLSEIHVLFDKGSFMVAEVLMLESSGDSTRIRFSNRSINKEISDSEFVLNN